jgi:hypothetical protein
MTKKTLISFGEYQRSLLEKGMAISVFCESERHGDMYWNEVVKNPSCDLLTFMRDKVRYVLADKIRGSHNFNSWGVADDEYMQELVQSFTEEQDTRQRIKYPELEWIDSEDPRRGIMTKAHRDFCSYCDVQANPRIFKQILNEEFTLEIEPGIRAEILSNIDLMLEELEIDPEEPIESYQCDWEEMYDFTGHCLYALSSEKKRKRYEKVFQAFVTKMLSPIFNNYKEHIFYIAAEDTAYFTIERPYFYPIIAAERLDGSYEITIFDGLNTL